MKLGNSIISEDLEIGEKVFPIKINMVRLGDEIAKERDQMLKQARSGDNEKAGEAFIRLTEIICGKEATDYMMEYYSKDYLALMLDIMPFYNDVVFPAVEDARRKALDAVKKMKHG